MTKDTHIEKVSVVILNYNGKGHAENCIRSVVELPWPELDIWVVDNASTDGSPELISQEFAGRVHIIRRTVNSATAGRNDGFRAALGKYVLSLDNDMVMTDPMIIHKAVAIMNEYPNAGVLSFKIGSEEQPKDPLPEHWWHPVPLATGKDQFFYSDWFPEGAVFFRATALNATGGYEEALVHGFECADLALRLLDQEFDILYSPTLTCIESRVRGWQHVGRSNMNYLCLRNKLWTAWKDYPVLRAIPYSSLRICAGALRALRYGWLDLWFKAVRDGVVAPRSIREKRRAIPAATWERIRKIRTGQYRAIECQPR
jgi:GT2 family glycosyltransferase